MASDKIRSHLVCLQKEYTIATKKTKETKVPSVVALPRVTEGVGGASLTLAVYDQTNTSRPIPEHDELLGACTHFRKVVMEFAPWARRIVFTIDPPTPVRKKSISLLVDRFTRLRRFAHEKLRGNPLVALVAMCDANGEMTLSDLSMAEDMEWNDMEDGFKDVQRRLNLKLRKYGWALKRNGDTVRLVESDRDTATN